MRPLIFQQWQRRLCQNSHGPKTTRPVSSSSGSQRPVRTRALCLAILISTALVCATATAQTSQAFSGSTPVGQSSQPLSVTVTMSASGTPAAPQALTLGIANADFIVSGTSCSTTTSYNLGAQCTVSVVFQPKYPGLRSGAVVIENSAGNAVLGSTLLTGTATGSLSVLIPGEINTVAGTAADWIYEGDGVAATDAPIYLPRGVAVDAAGNLFLADASNNRVRRVDARTGLISTVAGNGTAGYSGDGGLATAAEINNPGGLVLDGAGNLYFVDSNNFAIRRVDAVSGIITTVAGTPEVSGYSGNGGPATSAKLSFSDGTGGLAFDTVWNLYIADTGNSAIREVSAATGYISTVAGTGVAGYNGDNILATAAQLSGPANISIGSDGSLYIADQSNQRVRKVTAATGMITTIAGNGTKGYSGDGSLATSAEVNAPASVLLDPAGNIYIADSGNNRIRKIAVTTGDIQTISGSTEGEGGDGGSANLATMYGPSSLFFDQSGNLVFSDMFNNRVREIYGSVALLPPYPTMRVGKVSAPQIQGLENDGNADLTLGTPVLNNAELDPATTTCNAGSTLTFNTLGSNDCNFGVDFAPTVTGDPVLGSVSAPSNAGNSPAVINLSGEVLTVQPTTVSLTSSLSPSLVGEAVTFTATIAAGGDVTTGTVTFFNGGTAIAGCSNVTQAPNETAKCTTSALPLGSDSITASYSGDANDASALSPALVQKVQQAATIVLTVSPNPAVVTANVTLTATATAATGTPTGSITFYDGTTAIGSANLSAGGVASFSTTTLAVGTQVLSAKYSGDTNDAAETSNTVSEVVQQATTATTLTSSNTTAPVGSQVTFTATVTSTNGPEPTGTVEFMAGTTSLGSGILGSNGTAALSLTSLAPGTYSIVAVYQGDTDDATSSSAPLSETIQKIPTATTLSASLNPISAGAVLTLSAAVSATGSATGAGALAGQVTFSEGATVYGTATINSSGAATLQISTLSAGSHSIVATYSGNTNYATSTSAVLVEVVNSTATTTTLTSTAATTLAGEPASFTASVSTTTGIPTGSVSFYDGGVSIGQAQLNAQGVATLSTSTLTVGSHAITAVYGGNGNYNTSTSAALQHTVVLATTSLTLAGPAIPVNAGGTFVMTATLSNNGVAPTGTLTLHNGGATIATLGVTADGTFSFSNLSLGVGTYQLTAVYSGDAHNAAATSAPVTVVVQLTPTTTSLSSSVNPVTLGQSVTFTATVSGGTPRPTGTIEFLDGTTVLGSSTVNASGTATFAISTLTFGTQSITANYEGDTDHAVSTSSTLSEKVVEAATASLSSSVNPSIFGANVVFTVKITGVGSLIPTGTVIFSDGASTLGTATLNGTGTASLPTATLAVGSHSISVSYGGDTNYSATSAALLQTVQSATTQISLTGSANPAIFGTPLTLTATVTGNGGVVGTGSVTFTDGGTSIGSSLLNANGVASLSLSTLAPGIHTIVANYAGDSNINASSSTPLIVTVKQLTEVALASSANPTSTLSPLVLTATVTNSGVGVATGTVMFTDGSTELGTATLNASGIASLTVPSLSAGNHALQASYAGDIENFLSTSPVLTEGIQLRPTTTAITSTATDPNNPLQITLIAAVGWTGPVAPTGTVTFTSGTTVLGSSQVDSIGIATLSVILPTSTESIVATYSGDVSYASSNSLAATISGGIATQFTMQLNPSSLTLQSTQHGATSVTLTSLQGFSDTLQLGCLGLPDAATCTFSTPQVSLAANGTSTVQLIVDTGDPLGAGSTAKLERTETSGVLLCLLPCLLGIGLGARRRKFKASTLLLLVCMVAMTLSAVGCSGLKVNGTPAGTYTFKVTASGEGSGATVSQTMTLTVTQ
jgi:sugar lactone lactonase YvrE/predicted secreted protein